MTELKVNIKIGRFKNLVNLVNLVSFEIRKTYIEKHFCLLYLTANLAFRSSIAHTTRSVFHADQRDMRTFLIRTLGPEFQGHSHPHEGPQHQQGQGLILKHVT